MKQLLQKRLYRTNPAGRQLSMLPKLAPHLSRREHGGGLNRGTRKQRRPIDPKRPLHLTLRSRAARGSWSMLHPANARRIQHDVRRIATKWRVRIHEYSNVGNHLHLLIRIRSRRDFQGFLRELAGRVAMLITGARKSHALGEARFWDELAYSRVVEWGRDFARVSTYVITNTFEAAGLIRRGEKSRGLRAVTIRPPPPA